VKARGQKTSIIVFDETTGRDDGGEERTEELTFGVDSVVLAEGKKAKLIWQKRNVDALFDP